MKHYTYSKKVDETANWTWRDGIRGYPKYQVLGEQARLKFEATINVDDFDVKVEETDVPYIIVRGQPKERQYVPTPKECFILGESHNSLWHNDGTVYGTPEYEAEAKEAWDKVAKKQSERSASLYDASPWL